MHEFCKSEAARINLFHVVNEGQRLDENTSSTPENISSTRRLCFHSISKFDVIKSYNQKRSLCPFGKHIRSLLLFPSQNSEIFSFTKEELATIPNAFPLLRVLSIEFFIKFKLLPNELYNLHLLRYLAIKSNLDSLPKSFKNLRGLETLVIETTSWTLQIDEGIWNMKKLRHVHTNTSLQLPFPPKRSTINSGGKDDIRTLSTISPTSCTEKIFWKTRNLKKLGVRGDLSEFKELSSSFNGLKCLENLKLYGQYDRVLPFPSGILDARRLKKLSFFGTLFEWKYMAQLGSLEELEVLKLDDYAFKGENWELSNHVVFKHLQYLRIGKTNLIIWKLVAKNSFPALRSLILRNCSSLQKIPEAFANVDTLEVMELFHMSESAVRSAKEVKEKQQLKNCEFQLLIPPKMEKGPMTAYTDTIIEQAVNTMVRYVEGSGFWSGGHPDLYSKLKDVSFNIQMINARLQEAYTNPIASVDVLMLKTFQAIVNEAKDVARKYWNLAIVYDDETLKKFLEPYRRKVKSCASKIQSVRSKVNMMICQQHQIDLDFPTINPNNVLLTLQIERPIGFDKVIKRVEQAVNMLDKTVGDNVHLVSEIMKSEIEDMTSQIKTFTESLVIACKSPLANEHRVLRVIVTKFRTDVNEAMDLVDNYFEHEKKHGLAKAFDKIRLCGKLSNVGSEIQSIKEKVKTISEDHKEELSHSRKTTTNVVMICHLPRYQKIYSQIIIYIIICFNNCNTRSHICLHQYGVYV
nr:putative late blight resistance protein homolog R1B-8 [Ipomoea batatas]